ncbi:chorismate mutase [Pantoea sp. B65]|uniref:chorismate mutase n=1 Tax=Pantoea sp. B65 TaxID=2813359 RepID=UPI0039B39A41
MAVGSIEEVRNQIDRLDQQIVALIAQRSQFVRLAASFKKDENAVRAPDRVQKVIDKVRAQAAQHGLPESIAEEVYRAMINAFIAYELEQHQQLSDAKS